MKGKDLLAFLSKPENAHLLECDVYFRDITDPTSYCELVYAYEEKMECPVDDFNETALLLTPHMMREKEASEYLIVNRKLLTKGD